MSYRDDAKAHTDRADALIQEIAELERKKVEQAANERRLEEARSELATLQVQMPSAPREDDRPPGIVAHLLVFGATAAATFVGYTLLF